MGFRFGLLQNMGNTKHDGDLLGGNQENDITWATWATHEEMYGEKDDDTKFWISRLSRSYGLKSRVFGFDLGAKIRKKI